LDATVFKLYGLGPAASAVRAWAEGHVDRSAVDAPSDAHGVVFDRPADDDLHALLADHLARPGVAWIEAPVARASDAGLAVAAAGGFAFDVTTSLAYATPLATLFFDQLAAIGALDDGEGRTRIELAARRVTLAANWSESLVELFVVDEGPGYSRSAIDEAKARPGRGLNIVIAHADDVSFEDSGRTIRLAFRR